MLLFWLWEASISKSFSIVSLTIVAPLTTIGTPMAITLVFRDCSFNPFLWLPIPEPGVIPVSVSCIVVVILLTFLAASESIAIIMSGFIWAVMPFTIEKVSIPVWANTPGAKQYTLGKISICSATFGPNESGVAFEFPRPTIRIFFIFWFLVISSIWFAISFAKIFCLSKSSSLKSLVSIVT